MTPAPPSVRRRVAAWLTALVLLPGLAHADWLDEMPSVAQVAAVVDRAYNRGPQSQSTVAINTAAALILLRQLLQYRAAEDAGLSAGQRARMQAIANGYLQAELAIGRAPGRRRGALDAAQARQFYESRRYEPCTTADCYRYWVRFQLEHWNAHQFRELVLPQLFPCGDAPALLALAQRHAMRAPLIPFTPAAPLPGEQARLAEIPPPATQPGACTGAGEDIDGDGLCADWEASLRDARLTKAVATDACAPFDLLRAGTQDGESIQVRYRIRPGFAGQSIRLTACRSGEASLRTCEGADVEVLGRHVLAGASRLAPGEHEETILPGQVQKPDPGRPFVVVSGEAAGHVSTAYYRKWLVGVVVHGFTFRRLIEIMRPLEAPSPWLQELLVGGKEGEPWQQDLVASLERVSCYDTASFHHDWRFESVQEMKSLLTAEARRMLDRMASVADGLARGHDGDVVDFHLIGHSRGTVMLSEALKEQSIRPREPLRGSYLRVTLLDAHPASNDFSPQEDVEQDSAIGGYFYSAYRELQAQIDDPAIVLPAGVGIREVQVWFQHTRVKDLLEPDELRDPDVFYTRFALWGLGGATGHFIENNNKSGVKIHWYNITNLPRIDGTLTDHLGVALVYQYDLDRIAVPGKCVLPRP